MTTAAIIESGMTFGPYPAGQCFYVEKSKCYEHVQEGVRMAEFLLLRQEQQRSTIWVVEAKSSSPKKETLPNFDQFIDEIRTKLTHGFLLAVAACLRRHPLVEQELPEGFKALDPRALGFRFVLVINGHKAEWLHPLQSALSLATEAGCENVESAGHICCGAEP